MLTNCWVCLFFFFKHLYWSIIALQWSVSFCCITLNQLYIYIYPHISSLLHLPPTLPIPTLWVVTKHLADLSVLCSFFPLAIYITFGSVYMSMPLSHFVPAYPSPSPCPQVHSLHLHVYSCPAPRFFRTIFFFRVHIYVLAYGICFSDLLHSV